MLCSYDDGSVSWGMFMGLRSLHTVTRRPFLRMLSINHAGHSDIIRTCEDILWRRLPSNATIVSNLENRLLRNETSIPEMNHLLSLLDITQKDLKELHIIHVAGSKGKGSTSAFIESILRRAGGLRTALFTSPHLLHPRERLCFNGVAMDELEFALEVIDLYHKLVDSGSVLPGFFRFMTLLAFRRMVHLGRRGELDVAIVEVGMGGRYDATNVVEHPSVCVLTSLAMEHVKQLGPTLADIARHKIGIVKRGVACFSVPQPPEATEVMTQECLKIGAPLCFVEQECFSASIKLGIDGDHQKMNSSLALIAAEHWLKLHRVATPALSSLLDALNQTRWPGRHQIYRELLDGSDRIWYLDGAHTIESLTYACRWYQKHTASLPARLRVLLFHCSHDRPYEALLKPFISLDSSFFDRVLFAKPSLVTDSPDELANPDLSLHQEMASYWNADFTRSKASAMSLRDLHKHLRPGDQILVTGSLYLVGATMSRLGIPFSLN